MQMYTFIRVRKWVLGSSYKHDASRDLSDFFAFFLKKSMCKKLNRMFYVKN